MNTESISQTDFPASSHWPHAPTRRLSERGTYIVTAGTHNKGHFFRGDNRLDVLQDKLLSTAKTHGISLEAWAVFSNHYHFVAHVVNEQGDLAAMLKHLHNITAERVNSLDDSMGRQVWFQYWDTKLTFEKSYFARLNYVHQNAVKHGLVKVACQYRWCSANWFEQHATRAQVRVIQSFKIDRVKVFDDFEPI